MKMVAAALRLALLMTSLVTSLGWGREAGIWVDDGLGHTVKEVLGPREGREFSQQLRQTMGLPDRPPPRLAHRDGAAPAFMRGILAALDERGRVREGVLAPSRAADLARADTVVTFTSRAPKAACFSTAPRHAPHRLLYFDLAEVTPEHRLLAAELRLFYRPRRPAFIDEHFRQWLTRPRTLHAYLLTDGEGEELEVAQMELEEEGWLTLNVTSSVLAWILQPSENRGFRLAVKEHKKEVPLHNVGLATAHDSHPHRPILVAYFGLPPEAQERPVLKEVAPPGNSRPKRSANLPVSRLLKPTARSTCRMHSLHVSFEDLNWQHWVIAPDGYDANYCAGNCHFPMHGDMNATNHAVVQNMITVLGAVKAGDRVPPKACCTPQELATISVLYYDYSSNVVLKKYPKMIVKNCACR